MQWVTLPRAIDGIVRDCRVLNFAIEAGTQGGIISANSNGIVPDPTGDTNPFKPLMYERFDITIDQLEGEINCPYIFRREPPEIEEDGEVINKTEIIIPFSPLGGFAQFRINYQFILYPSDPEAEQFLVDLDNDGNLDGIVYNGSVETPRTLVPRRPFTPPPPPPPVFTIDEGQIKEALADKIYEKFFNSEEIQADISDVLALQTTTSEDGVNYKTGRESEDQQLILFKKDRNTPENKKDFEGDGSDGIQAISNIISASFAGTDESGVIDLSEKLNDEISIIRDDSRSPDGSLGRVSSIDPNYFDPPIPVSTSAPDIPKFYVQITKYVLKYSANFQTIDVDFAELWQYYQQAKPDDSGLDPKEPEMSDEWKNRLNLSQLTLVKPSNKIDTIKARATLDTNIFELLPPGRERQIQIDNFFDLFTQLIGTPPGFQDENLDNIPETIVDEQTDLNQRISTATEELYQQSFITRTDEDADDVNQNKTLESMRNRLNQYLFDVDSVVEDVVDSRPEYENQSSGFLKLRRLNQSILIKGPSETPSFGNWTEDGFTITMWVRFLNTTGGGSLFTYGNPMMRTKSSFRLETMTVQEGDNVKDDTTYDKARRVIRLVVWEDRREDPWWQEKISTGQMDWDAPWERRAGYLYESAVPFDNSINPDGRESKLPSFHSQMPSSDIPDRKYYFLNYTNIPTDDLEEWFFVCATYDPSIKEIPSFGADFPNYYGGFDFHLSNPNDDLKPGTLQFTNSNSHRKDELFWLGHKDVGSTGLTSQSSVGNRCKVEIISRSDLLRARGYRV